MDKGTHLCWERQGDLFICTAYGQGPVLDDDFNRWIVDLERFGYERYLCGAMGSPSLSTLQRERVLSHEEFRSVRLAVNLDASPVTRGVAQVFSWFMPLVGIFSWGDVDGALDFLGITDARRGTVTNTYARLTAQVKGLAGL